MKKRPSIFPPEVSRKLDDTWEIVSVGACILGFAILALLYGLPWGFE